MGALTINRKRGFDYYNPNYTNSPILNNNHTSKKPKISFFTNQTPNLSQKGKSRVFLYPKPINPIKREVHAPIIISKFGSFRNFNNNYNNNNNNFRGLEREIDTHIIDHGIGNNDLPKNDKFRTWKENKEVIDLDDVADEDIKAVEVSEEELNEMVTEMMEDVEVEVFENEVQEMETDMVSVDKDVKLEVKNDMEIEKRGKETTDLVSLNKKLSLLGMPVHKQLWESAERRNPKLSSLSFQIELHEKRRAQLQLLRPVKQPEEEDTQEDVLREAFLPLTKEEKAAVCLTLCNPKSRKVLATHDNSNIAITGEILQCLRPAEWLNDEVINVYLELLKEREQREPKKFLKCHFFNTFFYKKLTAGQNGYDYKSVRRWTTKRKLGYALIDCEKIFVPIHKTYHWCLAIINKKDKKFQYLDSLGGTDSYVLQALARYYVEEVKDKSGENIDVSSWKQENIKDPPAQKNGYDCGVFMVKYTDFYSRGLGLCFKQEDMPYFRLRTAKEILKLRAD